MRDNRRYCRSKSNEPKFRTIFAEERLIFSVRRLVAELRKIVRPTSPILVFTNKVFVVRLMLSRQNRAVNGMLGKCYLYARSEAWNGFCTQRTAAEEQHAILQAFQRFVKAMFLACQFCHVYHKWCQERAMQTSARHAPQLSKSVWHSIAVSQTYDKRPTNRS